MTAVLDLGCHTHAGHPADESIHELIGRYHPDVLYGFDPHPDLTPGETVVNGTRVVLERSAAWTWNGYVPYDLRPDRPLAASITSGPDVVPCFDLAERVNEGDVVKFDVEGAEYSLLEHLIVSGKDALLSLVLVEWHPLVGGTGDSDRRESILARLRCPVEPWA